MSAAANDLPEIPDLEPSIESVMMNVRVIMRSDLTARQAFILWLIGFENSEDAQVDRRVGVRSPVIADRCKISRQLAQHEVKQMSAKDLIRSVDSPSSGREKLIQLTKKGKDLLTDLLG